MSGKRVFSWLQKGWHAIVDPDREARVGGHVAAMHKELSSLRNEFQLASAVERLEIDDADLPEVVRRVLAKCVTKAWSDHNLSDAERQSLLNVARLLDVPPADAQDLVRNEGLQVFTVQLAAAFADGELTDAEYAVLSRIATSCGTNPGALLRSQFKSEGEAFVRNLFLTIWEDGKLTPDEWTRLNLAVRRLGMTDAEFRSLVAGPARQLVEHFLADFKSDEQITSDEESLLEWMLMHLVSDTGFAQYVRTEVRETQRFAAIRAGQLPSLPAPAGTALKSGEIVHFVAPCTYSYWRKRGGESILEQTRGNCVITDDRLMFTSSGQSHQLIHSKILGYGPRSTGLEIQCSGKGAGIYQFSTDGRAGIEIWIAAIQRANQTLVSKSASNTRHIPRDVRQRVWQRYGGKCADCGATQYLEYDHVIPVARGGGNSDNNVQLLCRGCNLKKSDAI